MRQPGSKDPSTTFNWIWTKAGKAAEEGLAARAWRAIDIDWTNAVVHVEPVEDGGLARWQGSGHLYGPQLCQAMRQVLAPDSDDPAWSQRARARMAQIRQENAELPADGIFLQAEGGGYRLWTFAGGRANNLLAKVLESVLGEKVTTSNLYLRLRGQAGASEVAIRQALDTLREQNRPNQDGSFRFAESCARGRLSKFEPCLPDRLAAAYMADVLTDAAGAADVLRAR